MLAAERQERTVDARRIGQTLEWMSALALRPALVGLGTALAVFASWAMALAQESRHLPDADRVPLHSVVDVSTLPAPAAEDFHQALTTTVKPRHPRDPEALQRLKSLLKAPQPVTRPGQMIVDSGPPPVAAVRLAVVSAFEGLANLPDNVAKTGFAAIPSDANLAVGPNHVFEMVNVLGRISDKSGGTLSTFTLRSFFQLDAATDESDPRVLYDAASDRWFATYLQPSRTQSTLVLAVSTTGDPTGTFCRFRLGDPTSETFLQDFPQLGISDDKVIVTYNAFNLPGSSFLGAGYYAINKADLVTGGGCPTSIRRVRVAPDPLRYGVQPAQSLSSTHTLYMAMNDGITLDASRIVVMGVNGVPGVDTVSEDTFTVNVRPWQVPPDAEQGGTDVRLTTNDESVITAVWQRGALWIGGNEQCRPGGDPTARSCLRVIHIQTDTRGVQEDTTFGASGQYYYYPALAPDGSGNLIVVFNASSATDFAGVRATGRRTIDPPSTLVASIPLRLGGGAQTSSSGRMGDFYGAAMDPVDPGKVWVIAEYIRATAAGDWGTVIAELTFGPPPTIALALNSATFKTHDELRLDLTVDNPMGALSVDIYLGAVLPPAAGPGLGCPMGDAVAFVTPSSGVAIRCLSSSPASFPRFVAGGSIAAGASTLASYFSFVWPAAPAGTYTIFVAFAVPGSLGDGDIGPDDIIAVASSALTFSP